MTVVSQTSAADPYAGIGVRRVINAGGRLTTLGGTTLAPEVAAAMAAAGRSTCA